MRQPPLTQMPPPKAVNGSGNPLQSVGVPGGYQPPWKQTPPPPKGLGVVQLPSVFEGAGGAVGVVGAAKIHPPFTHTPMPKAANGFAVAQPVGAGAVPAPVSARAVEM